MRNTIAIVLVAVTATTALAEPATSTDAPVSWTDAGAAQRHTAAYIAVGGLVLGAASLSLCLYERAQYDDALARLDRATTSAEYEAARNDANHAHAVTRYAGTTLAVGSWVAVGVAAYMYFSAPREKQRTIVVTPAVTPDGRGGGIGLASAF